MTEIKPIQGTRASMWQPNTLVVTEHQCKEQYSAMQAEIDELRAFIGDLPEAQNDLLKINKANMAEIARLGEEADKLRNRLKIVLQDASTMAVAGKRLDAENTRLKELLGQALGALKSLFSFEVDPERGARCSAAITNIEKEGIK